MSTYSRAWMRLTSFPGMGMIFPATLSASSVSPLLLAYVDVTGRLDDSTTPELDVEDVPLDANIVGKSGKVSASAVKSGRLGRDRGRGGTATVLLAAR